MNANEIYKNVNYGFNDYRSQYQKAENLQITVTAYSDNKGFDELGSSGTRWLRSPHRGYRDYAGTVIGGGGLGGSGVDYARGLSPCFCL